MGANRRESGRTARDRGRSPGRWRPERSARSGDRREATRLDWGVVPGAIEERTYRDDNNRLAIGPALVGGRSAGGVPSELWPRGRETPRWPHLWIARATRPRNARLPRPRSDACATRVSSTSRSSSSAACWSETPTSSMPCEPRRVTWRSRGCTRGRLQLDRRLVRLISRGCDRLVQPGVQLHGPRHDRPGLLRAGAGPGAGVRPTPGRCSATRISRRCGAIRDSIGCSGGSGFGCEGRVEIRRSARGEGRGVRGEGRARGTGLSSSPLVP